MDTMSHDRKPRTPRRPRGAPRRGLVVLAVGAALLTGGTPAAGAQAAETPELTMIDAGATHNAGIAADGTVWSWGDNSSGKLGDGTTTHRPSPVQVASLDDVAQVDAGWGGTTVARRTDGTVWTWGDGGQMVNTSAGPEPRGGQLCDGTLAQDRSEPAPASTLGVVTDVSAGNFNTLAVRPDGTVWGCGLNSNGELGVGHTVQFPIAVQAAGVTDAVDVSASLGHVAVRRTDGTVWTWGNGSSGRLCDGTLDDRTLPGPSLLTDIARVEVGLDSTLALRTDGTVWECGHRPWFPFGDPRRFTATPDQVDGLAGVVDIVPGGQFRVALTDDGTVWTWGSNTRGVLGDPSIPSDTSSPGSRALPAPVPGLDDIVDVTAGRFHVLAIRADGTVFAWGANANGQLGTGTTGDPITSPVETLVGAPPVEIPEAPAAVLLPGTAAVVLAVGWAVHHRSRRHLTPLPPSPPTPSTMATPAQAR